MSLGASKVGISAGGWEVLQFFHFFRSFTVGEAERSTCGNSHEEKKEKKEKDRFHLSLHKPSYDHILGFPDLGFRDFEIPDFGLPGFSVPRI